MTSSHALSAQLRSSHSAAQNEFKRFKTKSVPVYKFDVENIYLIIDLLELLDFLE